MNYIELINNAWSLREQGLLTVHECDLYLYLVHRCNRLAWKNPFVQPTDITCAVLGINRNALVSRRNRLKQLGLIDFREGERKTKPATYMLCNVKEAQAYVSFDVPTALPPAPLVATPAGNIAKPSQAIGRRDVDYAFVIATFNEVCKSLPKVGKLTEQRRQKLDAIARYIGIGKLIECFRIAENSHFLSKRKSKWRATFDWITEPDNLVKILEGSYSYESDSKESNPSTGYSKSDAEKYGVDKWAEVAAQIAGSSA